MKTPSEYSLKMRPDTMALISFVYVVVSTAALHFLNPAYSLVRSFTGNSDLGSCEFMIATTFFSFGFGCLFLAAGLFRETPHSPVRLAGLFFLGNSGVCMLIAGISPANEGGSTVPHMTTVLLAGIIPLYVQAYPETTFSFVHILALIGSLFCLSPAAFLLSGQFRQNKEQGFIYKLGLTLAFSMTAASVLLCICLLFPVLISYSGLINPILLVVVGVVIGLFWLFLMAFRLYSVAAKPVSK